MPGALKAISKHGKKGKGNAPMTGEKVIQAKIIRAFLLFDVLHWLLWIKGVIGQLLHPELLIWLIEPHRSCQLLRFSG